MDPIELKLKYEPMHRLLWILIVVPLMVVLDETQICFEDKYD